MADDRLEIDEEGARGLFGERMNSFMKAIGQAAKDHEIPAWCTLVFEGAGFRIVSSGTDEGARKTMRTLALWINESIPAVLKEKDPGLRVHRRDNLKDS